jgi:hypothetical protein
MITQQRTIILNLERPIQICTEVAREGANDPNPVVVILHTSCEGKEVRAHPRRARSRDARSPQHGAMRLPARLREEIVVSPADPVRRGIFHTGVASRNALAEIKTGNSKPSVNES